MISSNDFEAEWNDVEELQTTALELMGLLGQRIKQVNDLRAVLQTISEQEPMDINRARALARAALAKPTDL